MRSIAAILPILIALGCVTNRHEPPYVYKSPITVKLKSLQHTNNNSLAVFTVSNVSSQPMWYDGEARDHPACCLEYKSILYSGDSPGNLWGDAGLGRYRLDPGQSMDFCLAREKFLEPFRAGVWLSEDEDNKTMDDQIYWSEYVNP